MNKSKILVTIITVIAVTGIGWFVYDRLPVAVLSDPPGTETKERSAQGVTVESVAENLEAPWALDFTRDGDMFFTERSGRVRLIQDGELREEPLRKLPRAESEGGTLGIALDPDFGTNQYVYIYYTTSNLTNRIARYRFNGDELVEERLLVDDIPGAQFHNGGRIMFGPDGKLYAGTGDAEDAELAQDKSSLAGKILRINPDGDIPLDNPDPNSYVYSSGHRNVQGLDWDTNGDLYATEHGPQARDEINKIEAGANYGWPEVEGRVELGPRADAPVADYRNPVKSSGSVTWAPSGAVFYNQETLPPAWQGTFIFAGLRSESVWRYDPTTGQLERLFNERYGRLRAVTDGPEGDLYVLTSNRDGRGDPEPSDDRILRIAPSSNTEE